MARIEEQGVHLPWCSFAQRWRGCLLELRVARLGSEDSAAGKKHGDEIEPGVQYAFRFKDRDRGVMDLETANITLNS
jgi:hypothetical protein